MPDQNLQWQIQPSVQPPAWFIQEVQRLAPEATPKLASILWERGIRSSTELACFLNPQLYKPASPFEFGVEMHKAVERLQRAIARREKVAIWGDFDADGITATSVLWDGLGQFFKQDAGDGTPPLQYYIPNRLTESHGLNSSGIDALAQQGCQLIVTCDTGSTNIEEIEHADWQGIDVIVTDHHTLPAERPPVKAIINPRYLSSEHQLANLSGVAVAYKLVEALYMTLPDVPGQPLADLLDLVAIGLIADLVQLTGESRYLAKVGLEHLHKDFQKPPAQRRRPGVGYLLELCQKSGDRPTDISFGLGPRINAVSRIQGDASFCIELLTSRDLKRCCQLAEAAELANARRQSLQKDVFQQVTQQLTTLDLSTTSVIVLNHTQWAAGVLGLVAGQVAQEYGRPTILLTTDDTQDPAQTKIARGSARSVNQIDLYELVNEQKHLLQRFGGHPMAAGLSLLVENIPLFKEAINRQLWQQLGANGEAFLAPVVQADLVCTVKQLGQQLFRELKLLEPCGMGNPVPHLLIENCWFENLWHRNIQDSLKQKVQYIKSEFEIWDDSTSEGFPGVWWGHYKDEIPPDRCDAIVELDYNTYKKRYEVRLIAVRPCGGGSPKTGFLASRTPIEILDWRFESRKEEGGRRNQEEISAILVKECPSSWDELQGWCHQAVLKQQKLAIAYPPPMSVAPVQVWQQLVGVAKYLSRTGKLASRGEILQKLGISDRTLDLGLVSLIQLGFEVTQNGQSLSLGWKEHSQAEPPGANIEIASPIEKFLAAVFEEQFRRQYFYEVELSTIQAIASSGVRGTGVDNPLVPTDVRATRIDVRATRIDARATRIDNSQVREDNSIGSPLPLVREDNSIGSPLPLV